MPALGLLLLLAGPLAAATPKDELLRRVPDDVGFVAAVQNLRDGWRRVHASPFARKLLQTATGREVTASTDWAKLAELDRTLQQDLGLDWTRLRDDVLGDAVVFAYRPDGDAGLVLIWARDPAAAAMMFERLDASQKKAGQLLETVSRSHAGRAYKHRRRKGEPDEFQYQNGQLLAFGSGEALLKQVIDNDNRVNEASGPLPQRFRALGVESYTAVWWVNPRAFDKAIGEKAGAATGPATAVLSALALHWQALDGLAVFVDLAADARAGVVALARPDALPAPTRLFLAEAAAPSALADAFPADALVTITGRLPLPAALQLGPVFLPDAARSHLQVAARKTLGAVLNPEVLDALPSRLGPDWGICVSPAVEGRIPAVTAAVRLADPPGQAPAAGKIFDAVHALVSFAALGYNSQAPEPLTARTERQGDVEVRYFESAAANRTGVRPAYAWKGGYLVVATSPEVVRRFSPPAAAPRPAAGGENQASLIKVALRGWAAYLRDHHDSAAAYLAGELKLGSAEARRRLTAACELFDLLDHLDVGLRTEFGRATLTVRLQPAVPLAD